MISDAAREMVISYAQQLADAKHNEKGTILNRALSQLGWGKDKFYRIKKELVGGSGRKTRIDAGTTSQDMEALTMLAAAGKSSARANGKTLLETPNLISILSENGHEFTSTSNVNRLLRNNNMTAKQAKQDTTHGHFRTEHPNHVHLADASLCVLYYPPGNKKGMKVQKYTTMQEQYKNKPEMLEKIKNLRVWRYVLVDHCSGVIAVKYYQIAGENQQALYDFLLWSWNKLTGSPFHGLPRYVYWDKGSAMTSKAIKHALSCLKVDHIAHTTHLARATGAVEKANDITEKLFEGRLFLESVNSVDELNVAVVNWQNAYNANRLPRYNAKHGRHGMARTEAWLKIMNTEFIQHLRAIPCEDYCRYIFSHEPENRKVKGDLEITFRHPVAKKKLTYSLANVEGVFAGLKVLVSPLVINDECKVLVTIENQHGEDAIHEISPLSLDQWGYREESPVFAQGFDTKQDTVIDTKQKELDHVAYPGLSEKEIDKAKKKKALPFNGEINAVSHLNQLDLPAVITPKGSQFDVPTEFVPTEAKPLSPLQLKRAVMNALGRDLEPKDIDVLAQYQEVFVEDIPGIVDELLNTKASVLKLVNN